MKKRCSIALRNFFRARIIQTRNALHLTQRQMADALMMTVCSTAPRIIHDDTKYRSPADSYSVLGSKIFSYPDSIVGFRTPMPVVETLLLNNGDVFPICPRCTISLDREYMKFCDRCGQKLNWREYRNSQVVRPGARGK